MIEQEDRDLFISDVASVNSSMRAVLGLIPISLAGAKWHREGFPTIFVLDSEKVPIHTTSLW
jgi:hypothetical protein